ncbi:MAG: hypothetical protein ACTSXP_18955 [Promethearchaeota archaeon]
MPTIRKINDLHIHNSNSKCAWNRYPVKILYQAAKKAKLVYAGSSNHVYPPHDSSVDGQPVDVFQRHLSWTREEIDDLPADLPVYLGCELDIIDASGKDYLLPKYKDMVDYWIAGMHSFFNRGILAGIYGTDDADEFLHEYFDEWGTWAVNYIKRSRPDIFVHIFWQELECGLFHEKAMDECAIRIFDAAAEAGTAIECSGLQIRVRRPSPPFWVQNDKRGDHETYFIKYYLHLFELAKASGCMVSFGSDAHIPEDIGDIVLVKRLLEQAGFSDDDIFEPNQKV